MQVRFLPTRDVTFRSVCVLLLMISYACRSDSARLAADDKLDSAKQLADGLTLLATFDKGTAADHSGGDATLYTAESLSNKKLTAGLPKEGVSIQKGAGRWGDALRFTKKTKQVLMFRGKGNVPYRTTEFALTVSFWLKVDPKLDLPPEYVDPIQITDKKWNDASLFIDFSKDDRPRHLRLGVFADYNFWNPKNRDYEKLSAKERPLIDVGRPPFSRKKWTHIAFTIDKINHPSEPAVATLFLDGKPQGQLRKSQRFTWDENKNFVMLGIGYVGLLDELAIYNRALSPAEIVALGLLPGGLGPVSR